MGPSHQLGLGLISGCGCAIHNTSGINRASLPACPLIVEQQGPIPVNPYRPLLWEKNSFDQEGFMPPKQEGGGNSIIGERISFPKEANSGVNGSVQIDGKLLKVKSQPMSKYWLEKLGKIKTSVLKAKSVIVSGVVIGGIEAQEAVKTHRNR